MFESVFGKFEMKLLIFMHSFIYFLKFSHVLREEILKISNIILIYLIFFFREKNNIDI